MESCEYRQDLSDAKLHELLELPLAERAGMLPIWSSAAPAVNVQARGYSKPPLVYMETDAALPPALPPAESDDDDDEQEEEEGALPAAPARLTLPPTLPPLPKGKPAAAQIVQTFQEYVHVDGVSVSPPRLWTVEARQENGRSDGPDVQFLCRRCWSWVVSECPCVSVVSMSFLMNKQYKQYT